jgi:hypothetical protein
MQVKREKAMLPAARSSAWEGRVDEFATYFLIGATMWIVLQVLALWQMRGWWRKAAWLSAAAMGLALAVATLGGLAGSNLAPIWVVLAMPACLVWIVLLWIVHGIASIVAD